MCPPLPPPLQPQQVKSLTEQLDAANAAAEERSAEALALQRSAAEAALRLQREATDLGAKLDDARAGEEAALRRATSAEERASSAAARQAEVEANAAEQERSMGEQLRAALAQAERYRSLAASEQAKREQVRHIGGRCWGTSESGGGIEGGKQGAAGGGCCTATCGVQAARLFRARPNASSLALCERSASLPARAHCPAGNTCPR